ncbi:MAG: glycerol-3-phosphate dehydrogenase/oxidase [Actinomycetota bacterium]
MLELSAATRAAHLAAMAERRLDVLVVGGGITGAGVALDAVARGLSVGLLEREDFASGTSGRSSRLIHGGARYLRYGDLGLVREAIRERDLLVRLAPHFVRTLAFFIPMKRRAPRAVIRTGLWIADRLAGRRGIHPHRRVDEVEGARLAPGLPRPSGGLVYYDAKTDDARLTIEVLRQAAARGALLANHTEVEGLIGQGTISGAHAVDRLGGSPLEVRARMVVNATGVWADRIQAMAPGRPTALRPSKGVHVVLARERVPIRSALLVPSLAGGDALVFLIPWGNRVWVGTTDTPYQGAIEDPAVDPHDARILLSSVSRAFREEFTSGDVLASWAGVRPLLDTGRGSTRDLSRRHVVVEDPPGLMTVTGGKLTTYRAMAEQVVDRIASRLEAGGESTTSRIPLGLTRPVLAELDRAEATARRAGLPPEGGRRLVERYGDDWEDALALIRDEPSLGERVAPELPVLGVEFELARTREMAMTDDDVLIRRTRLTTMDANAARKVRVPEPGGSL